MSKIIGVDIENAGRKREIEVDPSSGLPQKVTVVFASGRTVVITENLIDAGDGQVTQVDSDSGAQVTSVSGHGRNIDVRESQGVVIGENTNQSNTFYRN